MEPREGISAAAGVKATRVLTLEGELTIAGAAQLRALLLDALGAGGAVTVDASAVSRADVSCLQLFCAAHRSALAQGVLLEFSGGGLPGGVIEEAAETAGFQRHKGCVQGCLWTGRRLG